MVCGVAALSWNQSTDPFLFLGTELRHWDRFDKARKGRKRTCARLWELPRLLAGNWEDESRICSVCTDET